MLDTRDIKEINAEFRANDESHLWPIRNKFNVTERAIRRVRRDMRDGMGIDSAEEYRATLDLICSEIVNDEGNW